MNNFHFHTDAKGKDLSKFINNYNLTILNDGTPTMADFATAPDLTLATTEKSPHTTWNPINQSCGSEHLPILISLGVKYSACGYPKMRKGVLFAKRTPFREKDPIFTKRTLFVINIENADVF